MILIRLERFLTGTNRFLAVLYPPNLANCDDQRRYILGIVCHRRQTSKTVKSNGEGGGRQHAERATEGGARGRSSPGAATATTRAARFQEVRVQAVPLCAVYE